MTDASPFKPPFRIGQYSEADDSLYVIDERNEKVSENIPREAAQWLCDRLNASTPSAPSARSQGALQAKLDAVLQEIEIGDKPDMGDVGDLLRDYKWLLAAAPSAPQPDSLSRIADVMEDTAQAFSHVYYLLIGDSPKWSPTFGVAQAQSDIEDRISLLRYNCGLNDPVKPAWVKTPSRDDNNDDEVYETGKRDGYEDAVQEIDVATGGDGEFVASTFPGATVDVEAMKRRIIDRAQPEASGTAEEPK